MFNYVAMPFVQNSKYFLKDGWKFWTWFSLPSSTHTIVFLRWRRINIRCLAIKHLQFADVFKISLTSLPCRSHLKGISVCFRGRFLQLPLHTPLTLERHHHFPESDSETGVIDSAPFHVTIQSFVSFFWWLANPCLSSQAPQGYTHSSSSASPRTTLGQVWFGKQLRWTKNPSLPPTLVIFFYYGKIYVTWNLPS